jgi:hypothetical protein
MMGVCRPQHALVGQPPGVSSEKAQLVTKYLLQLPRGPFPANVLAAWRVRLVLLCLVGWPHVSPAEEPVQIDGQFPGGNIVVQKIDGQNAFVAPDQRDIQAGGWWFYWCFRLRAPADAPVTVVFTEKNPLGVRGPAESVDGGVTWRWLGADRVSTSQHEGKPAWSFVARVPPGKSEVRYAFCPTYLQSHLDSWLAVHRQDASLRVERLCQSRKGRAVEMIRAGQLDRDKSQGIVLLTSRHHSCESMATYALEGFLTAVLADDDVGRTWRDKWEVLAVPFVDKDGVEDGDSGKNRSPHDHNRDYNAQPLYPEVSALMRLGRDLSDRVVASLDLHCPWIRGEWNDRAYFVGNSDPKAWQGQQAFAAVLERVRTGPIPFSCKACLLPYGSAWNTGSNFQQGKSCSAWARETFPNARLVTSLELPYADTQGVEVNADTARAFGRDLAQAVMERMKEEGRSKDRSAVHHFTSYFYLLPFSFLYRLPLVLGTSRILGSALRAMRRARAVALKMPSAMWWLLRP